MWAVRRRRNHRGTTPVGQRDTGHRAPARHRPRHLSGQPARSRSGRVRDVCPALPRRPAGGRRLRRRPGGRQRRLHLRRGGRRIRSRRSSRQSSGKTVYDYLEAGIGGSLGNAALVAKEALAAIDGKLDPTDLRLARDLLTALDATYDSTTHAYGDAETYTQSLAILALTAAAKRLPSPAGRGRERADRRSRTRTARGTSRASRTRPAGGDTNSTSIAIQALIGAGTPASDPAITKRRWPTCTAQQLSDGGFPVQRRVRATRQRSRFGRGRDPGSRRQPARIRPGSAWTKSGHTALSNVLTFQDVRERRLHLPGQPGSRRVHDQPGPGRSRPGPLPGEHVVDGRPRPAVGAVRGGRPVSEAVGRDRADRHAARDIVDCRTRHDQGGGACRSSSA